MPKYTPENRFFIFWSRVAITANDDLCWEWQGYRVRGYGQFGWNGKMVYAHRIAWSYPDYVIPDEMKVLHSCDNPCCVNPKHLFIGTQLENIRDMDAKGRRVAPALFGELNARSKLTSTQVKEIREKCLIGENESRIAYEYGINRSYVNRIKNNKERTRG